MMSLTESMRCSGVGIYVGDFSHQQNLKEMEIPKEVIKRSEACNLARKEFKMVFDELAQKNKK